MSDLKKKQLTLLKAAALLLLFGTPLVSAQNTGYELEEIIVTANKRDEQSLQDIAGSVQAISSRTLERTLAEGFEDYIKLVPGLTAVSSGPGQAQIVIRGVNSTRVIHTSTQTRSLAGLYLDEMPISLAGFNPDLGVVDVERIEVLRGPQGTLYGSSSMSGTIRVITKQPDTEKFSGRVGADTSFTKHGDINFGFRGSANIPMSDRVAFRFSAYATEKSGFIDNVQPGNEQDEYNDESTIGGRAQIAYFGDKLTASASLIYNKIEADGRPDEFEITPGDDRLGPITDELQAVKIIDDPFDSEFLGINLTLAYDFDNVNVLSATSYFDMDLSNRLDDTFRVKAVTPLDPPYSDFQNVTSYRTKVQEFRISSTYDSPLQWIAGVFYEDNRRIFDQTQPTPGTNDFFVFLTSIGAFPPGICDAAPATCFGAVADSVFDGTEAIRTEQIAFFGEATYSFTDALRLKLGFRWFDYENDVSIFAAGAANQGVSLDEDILKENDWVPKVEVSYDVGDDHMIYALYSEGFRLGGINGFIPPVCDEQLAELGTSVGAPFESDSLTNYEVGAKTSWLNNHLTANFALYRIDFEDIQSQINLDCGFFHRFNAGKVRNIGIEADFAYQASDALSLRFGFSYVDSEVKSAVPGLNSDGDEPPYVPEFTASGSIDYGVPIWSGFGYIRGDLRYVGSSGNEFSSRATTLQLDSYTIVDLILGYEFDAWTLNLFAKNLFDERVVTNIDPDRVQPPQFTRGRPRTIGVSINKNF